MANRALIIVSGRQRQVVNATTLTVGAGIDAAVAGALTIGSTTATSIVLSKATRIASTLQLDGVATLGVPSSAVGSIVLNNATNANTLTISSGVTSASYALTLPTAQGAVGSYLNNNGSGVLSWVVPPSPTTGLLAHGNALATTVGAAITTSGVLGADTYVSVNLSILAAAAGVADSVIITATWTDPNDTANSVQSVNLVNTPLLTPGQAYPVSTVLILAKSATTVTITATSKVGNTNIYVAASLTSA